MFGILEGHMFPEDPGRTNEIILAYVGDCVYELYVRNLSVETGIPKVNELDRISSLKSRASYQAEALKRVLPVLNETEAGVVRRARNKRITSKPKNADPMDYKAATALEALFGYLYISGQENRLDEIAALALCPAEHKKSEAGEKNE